MRYPTLRLVLSSGLLVGLVACGSKTAPVPSRSNVAPDVQQALLNAHAALIEAFQSASPERFIALLDDSPDLLIFHPLMSQRLDSINVIRAELPRMFARLGPATWTDVHPMVLQVGDVAWIADYILLDAPGLKSPFRGRGTEIWVQRTGSWRLIHAHWSEEPSGAGPPGA